MAEIQKSVTESPAWKKLQNLKLNIKPNLSEWFSNDPLRGSKYSITTKYMIFDYSRQLVTDDILDSLMKIASETRLSELIHSMVSGEKINRTEQRAVLHTALRNFSTEPVYVDGQDVMPGIRKELANIKAFSQKVATGVWTGITGKKMRNVVSIGIGGSYLGIEYLAEACKAYALEGMTLRFISNVDPTDFKRKTQDLDPEETLVVVVSKTFTTAETMANARVTRDWMTNALGSDPDVIRKHFVAVSSAADRVQDFGIDLENIFGFGDWVGGRFSATSAVGGVPLSLFLGYGNFEQVLQGAYWMDQHFTREPLDRNIPVLAGLLDIWNINFLGFKTRAIVPYSQAWSRYSAHCQQTEMESNGKSMDVSGRSMKTDTGEVVFGEPGTNSQHSFFQLIHQGTTIVPVDFIGFIHPQYPVNTGGGISLHEELMTNYFAQADALAFGRNNPDPFRRFTGNRPSNLFLLQDQNPFHAGVLLALLEHRAAVKGFIWGINSFDQFGVELGKELGKDIRSRITRYRKDGADPNVFEGLNASTSRLLKAFLEGGWQYDDPKDG